MALSSAKCPNNSFTRYMMPKRISGPARPMPIPANNESFLNIGLPFFQCVHNIVRSKIKMHRHYRNKLILKRIFISIIFIPIPYEHPFQPVIFAANWIETLIKLFLPFTPGLPAYLYPFYGTLLDIRDVDIEANPIRQTFIQYLLCDRADNVCTNSDLSFMGIIIEGKANRRDPGHRTLKDSSHRSRVNDGDGRI